MKWTIFTLVLILACLGSISVSAQSWWVMPEYPFYQTPDNEVCPSVYIYSPVTAETYYTNNILLNFSTVDAVECFYSSGGDFNPIACQYNATRTFSDGEVTVTVRAVNGGCVIEDSVYFTVYSRSDYWGYIDYWFILWIFIGGILLLIWMGYNQNG